MVSSVAHVPPYRRILWKSVGSFLRNPANKQRNKETKADENITHLSVVTREKSHFVSVLQRDLYIRGASRTKPRGRNVALCSGGRDVSETAESRNHRDVVAWSQSTWRDSVLGPRRRLRRARTGTVRALHPWVVETEAERHRLATVVRRRRYFLRTAADVIGQRCTHPLGKSSRTHSLTQSKRRDAPICCPYVTHPSRSVVHREFSTRRQDFVMRGPSR